jgi:hypothetical protein
MPSHNEERDEQITKKYLALMETEPKDHSTGGLTRQSRVLEKLIPEFGLNGDRILAAVVRTKKRWREDAKSICL